MQFVGVRFLNDPAKVYTYRLPAKAKVVLGDLLVVETDYGPKVVAAVKLSNEIPNGCPRPIKLVEMKVIPLAN